MILIFLAAAGSALAVVTPSVFTLAGAGMNLPITRHLADAFRQGHPEVVIRIPRSISSGGGIRAVAGGAIAMGLAGRPLREEEKRLGVTLLPYARTAIILAVHPSVPDDGLTGEELVQIYLGKKTHWKDGTEIILLTRQPGEASIEVLEHQVPGFREAFAGSHQARRWTTLFTDQELTSTLARTRHALGISDLGSITIDGMALRPLRFNGIAPTPENVASGRYPLVTTLGFVFRPEALPATARLFIEFVRSRAGEKVLRGGGYIPGG